MADWKELGHLGKFENIGVDKKIIEGEKLVTLLNYVDVYHHKYIDSSIPQMQVSASDRKIKDCSVEEGDIFVTPTSETVDDIGHSCVITETIPNAVYSYHIMRYRLFDKNMLLSNYINYAFDTENVKKQIFKKAQGLTRFGLSKDKFASILIPIPSLSEQARIVEILDTFTASIENLKQQIAERRRQYEYYRDQLLDLEGKEGVEMKPIKEIFDTRNGYTPSTNNEEFWDNGTLPWFKMEDIRDNGRILKDSILHITHKAVKGKGLFKANSIILATSATIGEHALITVEHLCNQRFTNFYPKKIIEDRTNMKYVYYYMFKVDEWCKQHINQGGFASVDMAGLYSLTFPIPSLQEQSRIVSILDTFEDSIANLEAQLKQREKQYEYYRNKLLTF